MRITPWKRPVVSDDEESKADDNTEEDKSKDEESDDEIVREDGRRSRFLNYPSRSKTVTGHRPGGLNLADILKAEGYPSEIRGWQQRR